MKVNIISVPAPPPPPPKKTYVIELSETEAYALKAFMAAGHRCNLHPIICHLVGQLPEFDRKLSESPYYRNHGATGQSK